MNEYYYAIDIEVKLTKISYQRKGTANWIVVSKKFEKYIGIGKKQPKYIKKVKRLK